MATIYDVAKAAHVSVGTVSNYLNNKYVGPARSKAIKDAIEALHYSPNRTARSLKSNFSSQIMLILPNLNEGLYTEIYLGVYNGLKNSTYHLNLALTNDSPETEQELLMNCLNNAYAGIILCTCMPWSTALFEELQKKHPLLFIHRKPELSAPYSFIGFDNYDIIYRLIIHLLESGENSIGLWTGDEKFSCERACRKAFTYAFDSKKIPYSDEVMVSVPTSKEFIFRQATEMFSTHNYPRYIITSSKLIADSIIEAAYYQNIILNRNICIISLGEGMWFSAEQLYCTFSTMRSAQTLGLEAVKDLLEIIAAPSFHEKKSRQLKDEFSQYQFQETSRFFSNVTYHPPVINHSKTLRLVLGKEDSSINALKYLFPNFTNRYNIDVEILQLSFDELLPFYLEQAEKKSGKYDIFHVDTPWIPFLAEKDAIKDISSYFGERNLVNDLIPNIIPNISMHNGRIYGMPMLFCSQLLFYRKDLFFNPLIQNEFEARYHCPLQPPKTWFEYDLIAHFFTQKFNPDSPCKYGTIMGTHMPELMMTEVFPRIWYYGGNVFDDSGRVCIYSDEVLQAYKNYLSCLECADPSYENILLPIYPRIFAQGNAAMMIAYDNHATYLVDRQKSTVYDKIGFSPVPGDISVQGGWNICVNHYSDHLEEAYELMDWISSSQIAIPYTLLGGGSVRKNICTNPEILGIYPWLDVSRHSFANSRKRYVPKRIGYQNPPEHEVEKVLSDVAAKALKDPEMLAVFLKEAEKQLLSMQVKIS